MMRRVHVVGTPGSGKSTVAAAIAAKLSAPHVELDALFWLPGWTQRPTEDFRALLSQAIAGDRWVVDGNYADKARDLVWARADTIVWLDLPRSVVMRSITVRTFRRWWRKEVLWSGNRESLRNTLFSRESMIWIAWSTHPLRREEYERALGGVPQHVVRLVSRAEVERWLATV